MSLKSNEDFIREKSINELKEVTTLKSKNYSQEEIVVAHEELFRRGLKNMNPIEQTDSIISLSDDVLKYLVEQSGAYYNTAIFSVARAEYKKRGFEIDEWYYLLDGQKNGPISLTELQKLVERKYLLENSHVYKEGMREWTTVENINEINVMKADFVDHDKILIVKQDSDSETLSDMAAIFSFLFPIVGIVIYLSNENSAKGKKAGNIALVSILICVFFYLLVFTTIFR